MLKRLRGRGPAPSVPAEIISMRAIAVVANRVRKPMMRGWERVDSTLHLRPDLDGALDGLDGHSHLIVVFWMDGVPEAARGRIRHRLHGDESLPIKGDLATRTQNRPNPIGVSVVELLEIAALAVKVRGLDAIDGTPVLDIKPYIGEYDARADARAPGWVYGRFDEE